MKDWRGGQKGVKIREVGRKVWRIGDVVREVLGIREVVVVGFLVVREKKTGVEE